MDSFHFVQDTRNGVVTIYRGNKTTFEVSPRSDDGRYRCVETREGIATVGAGSCSGEKSPKCEAFAASSNELLYRLKNQGIDETMADQILSQLHGGT